MATHSPGKKKTARWAVSLVSRGDTDARLEQARVGPPSALAGSHRGSPLARLDLGVLNRGLTANEDDRQRQCAQYSRTGQFENC